MSLLNGKQIKSESIDLVKLNGSGVVTFEAATMSFQSGAVLNTDTANITGSFSVVNKEYVDGTVSAAIQATTYFADAGLTLSVGNTFSVLVNSDALEIDGVTNEVSLKSTIAGNRTFSDDLNVTKNFSVDGDAVVKGNFTVQGTVSVINTQEVEVFDNIITLAKGNTGSWVDAGIKVDRGSDPQARLIWSETFDVWTAGLTGSEQAIGLYAGRGLTKSQYSPTFSIDASTGLDFTNDDKIKLADTTVALGNYGLADSVATFTVDAQGRLTAAQDLLIDITSAQVNNFTSSVETLVFNTDRFENSDTIEFDVTAGSTVSAYVKINGVTASGLSVAGDGISVNVDGSTIQVNTNGQLEVIAGSAKPEYVSFLYVGPGATGDPVFELADIIDPSTESVNEYSRLEVYINGLKQGVGYTTGRTQIANLPVYNSSFHSIEFDSAATGEPFIWRSTAYELTEGEDLIEVVFEKN